MTRVALIAHDEKKDDMVRFVNRHYDLLKECELVATGTTGKIVNEETKLKVDRMASGPLGGDQMIGAKIAQDKLDCVIFLRDPLTSHPHEPDITGLLRVSDVHNIPLATNQKTADLVLEGLLD